MSDGGGRRPGWLRARWVRALLGGIGAFAGLLVAVGTAAVGHCAAIGGSCPSTPPPLLEDEVFGGMFFGLALLIASPMLAANPTRRGVLGAAGVVLVIAGPLAYAVARASHQGSF